MNIKRFMIYMGYFCMAFVFFAALRFPEQTAGQHISAGMEKRFPGLSVTMEKAAPGLPPGLNCINPVIRFSDLSPVLPDSLRLSAPFSSLLQSKKEILFSADLFNGSVSGTISGVSLNTTDFSSVEIALNSLSIKKIPYATRTMTATLSFDIQGRYMLSNGREQTSGNGELQLSDVICVIDNDWFQKIGIDTLTFRTIDLAFHQEDGQVAITSLSARGDILTIALSGTLAPKSDRLSLLETWVLDVDGKIHPRPEYVSRFAKVLSMEKMFTDNSRSGIPIRISGPLSAPEVSL